MTPLQHQIAVSVLRWTLGLVVAWESCRFAVSTAAADTLQRMGLPAWTAGALGGLEVLAAILFLIPRAGRVGGWSLLGVFAVAAILHVLHGQFDIGPLFVYGAAVLACSSPPLADQATPRGSRDGR
jgi:uncharacterized membrane protein YphA (DoxX/SURF4 family)